MVEDRRYVHNTVAICTCAATDCWISLGEIKRHRTQGAGRGGEGMRQRTIRRQCIAAPAKSAGGEGFAVIVTVVLEGLADTTFTTKQRHG